MIQCVTNNIQNELKCVKLNGTVCFIVKFAYFIAC